MESRALSSSRQISDILSGLKSFQNVKRDVARRLSAVGVMKAIPSGGELWKSGERAEFCAIIVSGWIELQYKNPSGHMNCLDIFGPGDVIGLTSLLRKEAHQTSSIALSDDVRIVQLFLGPVIQSDDPRSIEVMDWVREMCLLEARIYSDKVAILSAGSAERKLLQLILHLVRRFGVSESGGAVAVPLAISKTRAAGMIDVRAETAIRMISGWKKNGRIEWLDDRIIIPDLILLERSIGTEGKTEC